MEPLGISATDWQRMRQLLDAALDLPATARSAWLDRLQGDDLRLRPRLRALLTHAEEATGARFESLPGLETADFAPAPPQQVGPYRLLRRLGEGGMGSVWLAERDDMLQGRRVALKLPREGWQRPGLAGRLVRECEILAALDHPNIARVIDAGVSDGGQPWLALEHVDGERLDRWAERRALDVPQRVRLFVQVVQAVVHAHARLIVHRDLKPGNILVTEDGQAKLLDFGIAKLLQDDAGGDSDLTRETGRVLTPGYASPEQVLGLPITTATDIHALGVVLFELLAGCRPYPVTRDTPAALEEAIAQGERLLPSAVAPASRRPALRGDLDTIVLKALKRDPLQRYATAAAFADDLQRHLEHRPVLARPDSAGYRLRRALLRHRVAVSAGGAVVAALLAGTALATWQAMAAREQRDQAVAERERADRQAAEAQLARRIAEGQAGLSDFLLTDASQGLSPGQALEQVEQAVAMVRKQYRRDPLVRADLLADAGNRLRWIGENERARALWSEAEALMREAGHHEGVSRVLCMSARERALAGEIGQARELVARGHEAMGRIADAGRRGAGCLLDESVIERRAGQPRRALELAARALALEHAAGRADTDLVATLWHELGRSHFELGHHAEAAASARAGLAVQQHIGRDLGRNHQATWFLLGMARRDGGQTAQALAAFGGEGRFDPLGADLPPAQRLHIVPALLASGQARSALELAQTLRPLLGTEAHFERALLQVLSALAHLAMNELAAARVRLDRVEPYFARLVAERDLGSLRYLLARAEWARRSGRLDEAATLLERAQAVLDAPSKLADPFSRELPWRALHRARAELALAQGQPHEAAAWVRRALERSQGTAIDPALSLHVGEDRLLQAEALRDGGHAEAARAEAEAARVLIEAAGGPAHPLLQRAARWSSPAAALADSQRRP